MARWFWGTVVLILVSALGCPAQNYPHTAPAVQTNTAGLNLPRLESEAILWLQALVRINTSNPPGNELAAAKYLADILQREGINSEIFESAPGRGLLVARLSATAMPNPSNALLLMGHLDVVGVDKSKWTVDPFAGVIRDNYLYGRGAIDDKGMTIANVAVLIALKRSNARLNRDVILLAENDEEAGGEFGMRFAVDKHWDKIAAGFAINEGGCVVLKDGRPLYVGVQAAEKVSRNLDVVATGTSGHASIPRSDDPVTHLAAAIEKIGAFQTPVQFNSITRPYFEGLAKIEDEETSKWIHALDESDRADHAARWISNANPVWNSMIRDTIVPTMLEAGIRPNVVPAEARGVVNIRLLPGNLLEPLVSKLEATVNDSEVKLDPEPDLAPAAPSSSLTSDLYKTIARVAGQQFPGVPVLPYMSTMTTDSSWLRLRNVQAYGLLPFPLTEDDALRMHGNDERIPLDSFRKGVDFLYGIVSDFAVSK
jgi:acetylornithine deacetylase/succinyl-diaminopimelate desuccinylase-like protein